MPRTSTFVQLVGLIAILAICTIGIGSASGETAAELLNRARAADRAMNFLAAESLYVNAVESLERSADSTGPLISAYTDLAAVRTRLCRFDDAQEAYDRALLLATTTLGTENVTVASVMNGLGRIEFIRGHYGKSERLFLRSLTMAEKTGGLNHPAVADALRGLADVCRAERRFTDGEDYAMSALRIREKDSSATAEDLALCYVSWGFNMRGRGSYDTASANYLTAESIAVAAYGEDHPVSAQIYNHRAALNNNLYRTDSALLNANRALAITERLLCADGIDAGISHFNLARAYTLSNRADMALPHYDLAAKILKPLLGENHPLVTDVIGFQSFCYRYMRRFDDAMRLAADVARTQLTNYIRNSANLEGRASASYSFNNYYAFSGYPGYYFDAPVVTEAQSRTLAELAISSKGLATEDTFRRHRVLDRSADEKIVDLQEQLGHVRSDKASLKFVDPWQADPSTKRISDSLTRRELEILSVLAESEEVVSDPGVDPIVKLEDVCSHIPDGACLIEYYGYHYVLPTTVNVEETRYGAVVLDRKGIRGHRCLGGNGDSLVPAFDNYLALLRKRSESSTWSQDDWDAFIRVSRMLYNRLWSPIEDLVGEGEFVILAPDINISQISFAGLPTPHGGWLAEEHPFQYISSSRELLRYGIASETGRGLFVLFDPDYDASATARLTAVTEDLDWGNGGHRPQYAVRNIRPTCEKLNSLQLTRLPNTRQEVEVIVQDWQDVSFEPVRTFDGARATEESLKRIAPSHRALHIATHGYFVQDKCRDEVDRGGYYPSEPMLYSGLLLAGANQGGRGASEAGAEDGILTALEVSGLNLDGTNLVVLSACESGRGDISTCQGTYGISRAFQLAGARQVVSALWPVSDAASIDVMAKIYGSPDKTISEALHEFAVERINADRAAGRETDPFYWAPYISYGDWRAR